MIILQLNTQDSFTASFRSIKKKFTNKSLSLLDIKEFHLIRERLVM